VLHHTLVMHQFVLVELHQIDMYIVDAAPPSYYSPSPHFWFSLVVGGVDATM